MRTALALALVALVAAPAYFGGPAAADPPVDPVVVIAHIDQGINPYHSEFRDTSTRAYAHPCTYVAGYPCSVPALWLDGLNLTGAGVTWEDRFAVDHAKFSALAAAWNDTANRTVPLGPFWIPGTKIIASLRFGTGGVYCPAPQDHPPPMLLVWTRCYDWPLLDDYGHGTMTATRMAGNTASLCPMCRIVSIEGLGGASVRWVADRGWIDVQSNSWLSLVPNPVNQQDVVVNGSTVLGVDGTTEAFAYAQSRMLTYAASGNGAAYIAGVAPTPTQILSTAAPGVILVGAHDNGRVNTWSGAPAHVVADGYGGSTAGYRDVDGTPGSPFACCTSAAAPYAAGGGARIVWEARRILGDTGVGLRGGSFAVGTPPAGLSGLLADGSLSFADARAVLQHSAEARPAAGKDDGLLHWMGSVTDADLAFASDPYVPRWGLGANPYCGNCWASPVRWSDVPASVPAYVSIGYGAVNERSTATALAILGGGSAPDRSDVDAFFALEAVVRAPFYAEVTG